MTYAGTIMSTEDYQLKDNGEPRFHPSGNPVMDVRITLANERGPTSPLG